MPRIEIEGFEQIEELGRGGYGVVYRAWQPEFGRFVAIKVVSAAETRGGDPSLEREALAVGSVSGHPNIVPVHTIGVTEQGDPYLVMPYFGRGSLGDRLATTGALEWREALAIGIKLSGALDSAHATGVLHRDVKPDNVLLTDFDEPQLADFGIARLTSSEATAEGGIAVTVLYAAPEVLSGQGARPSSDVYSLACAIYATVEGHPPFVPLTDEPLAATISRIATEPPKRPGNELPEPAWAVLKRGLAKEPAERFTTAAEFGLALQRAQRASGAVITPITLPPGRSSNDTTIIVNETPVVGTVTEQTVATVVLPAGSPEPLDPQTPVRAQPPRRAPLVIGALLLLVLAAAGLAWLRHDAGAKPTDEQAGTSTPPTEEPSSQGATASSTTASTVTSTTSPQRAMTAERLLAIPIPDCPVPLGATGFAAIVGTPEDPSAATSPAIAVGDLTGDGIADGAYTTVCNGGGSGAFYDTWAFDASGELLGRLPVYKDAGQTLNTQQSGLEIGDGVISIVAVGPSACTACVPEPGPLLTYEWNGTEFVLLSTGDV